MNCLNCKTEILSTWNYCPKCGVENKAIEPQSKVSSKPEKVPERFLSLAEDYFRLTGLELKDVVLESFLNNPKTGPLSVINSEKRIKAGKAVRQSLPNGKYSLSIDAWLDEIYDNPQPVSVTRVWITPGGHKYHSIENCAGIKSGQNYAQAKGKEIYKAQFVLLRDAAFVNEFKPCDICKPPKFKDDK